MDGTVTGQAPLAWPDPGLAWDERLDIEGVCARTGCNAADYAELAQAFTEQAPLMLRMLEEGGRALEAAARQSINRGTVEEGGDGAYAESAAAAQAVRSAAHELATSFGIVGSRKAEAYARMTDLRLKPQPGHPMPAVEEMLAAARAMALAVERVLQLLPAP